MSEEMHTPAGEPAPVSINGTRTESTYFDHPIQLTSFKELASPKPGKRRETTWGKLVTRFASPGPAPADKHELPLWCPTVFEGDRRKGDLAEAVYLFAIDIDNEIKPTQLKKYRSPPPTTIVTKGGKETNRLEPVNTIEQVAAVLPGSECFWHTSFSHRPNWPKYRIAWLLKRPATPTEYAALWERLEARFRRAGVFLDPATKNISRAWFVPAKTEHFSCGHLTGELLDPDTVLAEAEIPETNQPSNKTTPSSATNASGTKPPGVLQQVLDTYRFVRGPTGRAFAARNGLLHPIDSDAFISKVAYEFSRASGDHLVTKDIINNRMLAVRGGSLPVVSVPIRFANHNGNIYLDLGDDTGRVVEITSDGPRVLPSSPVPFYRPSSLRPLPTPILPRGPEAAVAALEQYRALLCVDRPSWVGCLAFIVQAMQEARVYSILICRGPKGIGKTTRARLLRRVVDPRRPELTGLPKTKDDLCIQAENAHILVFDNLRYLDHEMSDALCRLSTGDGQEKRALYTDRDLVAFEVSKPIILTSISDAATEPDILDRSLFVDFERPEVRRTDDEIDAAFEKMHAEVLGALCFAASLGLERRDELVVPSDVRMQVPCRFAAGMEGSMLEPGEVVAVFRSAAEQALATTAEDAFVTGFRKWAAEMLTWTGSASELLEALTQHAKNGDEKAKPPKWIPGSPRALRGKLDTFRDVLKDGGISVSYGSIGRDKEKRNGITIKVEASGAGGVRRHERRDDNAPCQNSGDQAAGVRGAGGVRDLSNPCPGSSDDDTRGTGSASGSFLETFEEETHPTHPTHPNPMKQGISSGVGRESQRAPRTPGNADRLERYGDFTGHATSVRRFGRNFYVLVHLDDGREIVDWSFDEGFMMRRRLKQYGISVPPIREAWTEVNGPKVTVTLYPDHSDDQRLRVTRVQQHDADEEDISEVLAQI